MTRTSFDPDWRVAPGETLKDVLDEREISESALAAMTGLPPSVVRGILDGNGRLTEEIAGRLALAVGVPSDFWLNLEANYRKPLKRPSTREGA